MSNQSQDYTDATLARLAYLKAAAQRPKSGGIGGALRVIKHEQRVKELERRMNDLGRAYFERYGRCA